MKFQQLQRGFTLIEIMIVVAIISILAAIAISRYSEYIAKAQQNACLSEAKVYSNYVFILFNDKTDSLSPVAPTINACQSITDAQGWTLITQQKIIAVAKAPSNARIECDVPNGAPCRILP